MYLDGGIYLRCSVLETGNSQIHNLQFAVSQIAGRNWYKRRNGKSVPGIGNIIIGVHRTIGNTNRTRYITRFRDE